MLLKFSQCYGGGGGYVGNDLLLDPLHKLSGCGVYRAEAQGGEGSIGLENCRVGRGTMKGKNLQSLFGLHVYSCTHWLRPRNCPLPPHLGSCTRALLVSQDRRHFFVTHW